MINRRQAIIGGVAVAALTPYRASAAPRSQLLEEHWLGSGADGGPDHGAWTAFLNKWRSMGADGVARLDYGAALERLRDVADYVAALSALRPTEMKRGAAFVYWANLYNAATVMLVLADYPVSSIKEVRGGLFNSGPWGDKVLSVEGRDLSLDDIEHGIMRPVWRDPRVHYAVNCASIGCPNIGPRAWEATRLEADLDAAAREYVNHPRGARFGRRGLVVSSIYEWFKEDFGDNDAGVIRHLSAFAAPDLASKLAAVDEIYDDEYDWKLNDIGA